MRILHIIDSLNIGGAERVLVDLCNILHDRGVDVGVLVLTKHEQLASLLNPDIPYFNLERKFKYSIPKIIRFHKICKSYSILHVHMRHVLKYVLFCDFFSKFRARMIFHDHFGDIRNNQDVDPLIRRCKNSFQYVGVSQELKLWAVNKLGKKEKDCTVISNIVRKEQVNKNSRKEDRFVLVSNIRPTKNIEFAIQLVATIKDDTIPKLDIYGQVVDESYFQLIKELINRCGLEERITIITNSHSIQQELPQYSFALHTSKSETGPLVLIEYLAQNIPFLAFKTGEVAEQIISDIPEFFIDSFDLNDWMEQLRVLRRFNKDYWKGRVEVVYSRNYSEDSYFLKWMNIYNQMLNY